MELTTEETFESRYRDRHIPMVRLAYTIVGSQPLAEDIVHDAFIKVSRSCERVEQPAAYLRRAVVNEAITALRRRGRESRRSFGTPPVALLHELDETRAALAHVPARQRVALALRYYSDLPIADVASSMHGPLGTAKSLIHRGLENLKEVREA